MISADKCKKLLPIARAADEIGTILNSVGYYANKERALGMVILAFNTIRSMIGCPKKTFQIIVTLLQDYMECAHIIQEMNFEDTSQSCKLGEEL